MSPEPTEPPTEPSIETAYAELARPTDATEDPVVAVRRRMRHRARRRRRTGAALAACVVVVLAFGTVQAVTGPAPRADSGAGGGAAPPSGALREGGASSCAVGYDRTTLRQQRWAADATVTGIGRGITTVTVRLAVHTWYRGGSGETLRVRLPDPDAWSEDGPPAYEVGTRLLLSGVGSGDRLVPWGCGFTRYYDEPTAAVWAQVFAR